jgi:DNA polymerase-3 subunit gamma/tau
MTQALYRKWRPHKWAEVIGQEHIVQTLRNAIVAERVAHAYLFAGPRGTGKTTSARLLAKAVNCLDPDLANRPCDTCEHCVAVNQGRFLDLIEIDAASNTSVEDVRELRDKINFSPNQGRYKVYVIDEVHMLSTAAFNALLKTLEEPPAHAIFVLATTEIHKIPATILSRCQRHEFRRIPVADIVFNLKKLAEGENIQIDESALTLIARQSAGGMRDAISLLDQLASTGQAVTSELAQAVLGAATDQIVLDLINAVQAKDSAIGLAHIHTALDSGSDPRQFARQIVDYLRQLLLIKLGNANQVDATRETRTIMARHAQNFTTPDLLSVIKVFNTAAAEARISWQPSLPLEMAFVEAITEAPMLPAPVESVAPKVEAPQPRPTVTTLQPKTAPPAEPPPSAAQAPTSEAGKRINEQWRQIIQIVKQQKSNVAGLLNSVKTRHLQDNILLLGFASDVLKSQMEKPENIEVVQNVLHQLLGEDIRIRCTTVSAQRTAPPPDVEHDGMVASAVRDLGGEIVDVQ